MPSFVIRLALTGRSYFRDAKKDDAEEAARRRKSSVAHCRGSQRPQRRTCESAVMGIMQNYGRAARETRGDTWGLSNRRVRLGRMSSRISSRRTRGKGSRTAFCNRLATSSVFLASLGMSASSTIVRQSKLQIRDGLRASRRVR